MSKYNINNLDYDEFEEFAKSVLNKKLKMEFTSFKKGPDGGIDLLYENKTGKIIVQVKHFKKSTFSHLKTQMKNEKIKMDYEKPDRYILFTSLPLSVKQFKEIMNIMEVYIKSTSDIIALDDINNLLSQPEYKNVVKDYYRLWFSNVDVLENILKSSQHNYISYFIKQIYNELPKYVETSYSKKSQNMIAKSHALFVLGNPGVGKTTICKLLISKYLSLGYSLKTISGNNIREIEEIVSINPEEKEIIFVDDFLGVSYLEIRDGSSESKINSIIKRFKKRKNKILIMTSRITIYNKANLEYDRISELDNYIEKNSIHVKEYSRIERAKIFYNHCHFNLIEEYPDYFSEIIKEQRYFDIVNHRNYNPRIISEITDLQKHSNISKNDYYRFILEFLENPNEIRENEYRNTTNYDDKLLLKTLYSFGFRCEYNKLRKIYLLNYQNHIKNNGLFEIEEVYEESLRILNGSFIKIIYNDQNTKTYIEFLNPSVFDFFREKFSENLDVSFVYNQIFHMDQLMNMDKKFMQLKNKDQLLESALNRFSSIEGSIERKLKFLLDLSIEINKFSSKLQELITDYYNKIKSKIIILSEESFEITKIVINSMYFNTDIENILLNKLDFLTINLLEKSVKFENVLWWFEFIRTHNENSFFETIWNWDIKINIRLLLERELNDILNEYSIFELDYEAVTESDEEGNSNLDIEQVEVLYSEKQNWYIENIFLCEMKFIAKELFPAIEDDLNEIRNSFITDFDLEWHIEFANETYQDLLEIQLDDKSYNKDSFEKSQLSADDQIQWIFEK